MRAAGKSKPRRHLNFRTCQSRAGFCHEHSGGEEIGKCTLCPRPPQPLYTMSSENNEVAVENPAAEEKAGADAKSDLKGTKRAAEEKTAEAKKQRKEENGGGGDAEEANSEEEDVGEGEEDEDEEAEGEGEEADDDEEELGEEDDDLEDEELGEGEEEEDEDDS